MNAIAFTREVRALRCTCTAGRLTELGVPPPDHIAIGKTPGGDSYNWHIRVAQALFRWMALSDKRRPLSAAAEMSRSMPPQRFALPSEAPGLAARRIAADILDGVLHKRPTLDDQLDGAGAHPGLKALADRDRALMRRLVATILRRLGTLGHVLSPLPRRGLPTDAPRAQSALLIGAAQILWMDVPDHAAVDLSVRLVQSDRRAAKN